MRTSVSWAPSNTVPVSRQSVKTTRLSTASSSRAPDRSQWTNSTSRHSRPVKRTPARLAPTHLLSWTRRSATRSGTWTSAPASTQSHTSPPSTAAGAGSRSAGRSGASGRRLVGRDLLPRGATLRPYGAGPTIPPDSSHVDLACVDNSKQPRRHCRSGHARRVSASDVRTVPGWPVAFRGTAAIAAGLLTPGELRGKQFRSVRPHQPTVAADLLPGDVGGGRAGEERHDRGEFLGCAVPPGRDRGLGLLAHLLLGPAGALGVGPVEHADA